MSKMKHLLRKLHIGNDNNHHHNHHATRPLLTPPNSSSIASSSSPSPTSPSPSPSPSSSSTGGPMSQMRSVDSCDRTERDSVPSVPSPVLQENVNNRNPIDFSFLEEEFQVQLALALSASDPDTGKDAESDQIKAARQLSLGCPLSVADNQKLSGILSLKYWNYNILHYDEKIVDGFYDVFTIPSTSLAPDQMPLLVDLQAVSIFDKVVYEVISVNRIVDAPLRHLENKAYAISVECQILGRGPFLNGLIRGIADLVVDAMGGPVNNAEEIRKRWRARSNEMRSSLNSIVLPLGSLDIGLSCHRALLFKVLADRINLPCMLVKGSLYTGTDEGAVNLIKMDDGSEYIIDLMGAPGELIPAEIPSSLLLDSVSEARVFPDCKETTNKLNFVLEKVAGIQEALIGIHEVPGPYFEEPAGVGLKQNMQNVAEPRGMEESQPEYKKLVQGSSFAQENQVNDVSQYVISAAENPEFAQKLHAVLSESGASPPSELFADMNFDLLKENKPLEQKQQLKAKYKKLVQGSSFAQENQVNDVSQYVISAAENPEFAQKLHAVLSESGASPPSELFADMNFDLLKENKPLEQKQQLKAKTSLPEIPCRPDKYWSNSELSLLPPSGVGHLHPYSCDNEQEFNAEWSAGHEQRLIEYCVDSQLPPGLVHGGAAAVALGMNQMNPKGCAVGCGGQKILDHTARNLSDIEIGRTDTARGYHTACDNLDESTNPMFSKKVSPILGEVAEWEIPWEDLQIGERIGIGSYGEVYHAEWNGTEVAVKKFLVQDFSGDALLQFKCEAELMIRLRHPNVVLFMGAVTRPPNLSILTEYLPRESLYRLLHRSNSLMDEKRRLKMALDVAKGMNYLHTSHPTIVHRDLKTPNLLVDKNWVVKVCDFGMSRLKHHTFLSSKSIAGTPEWMAPEVLRNEPSNEKCDVYSFGVILWELATLRIPWTELNPMQVVGAVGFQHRRLEIPENIDPKVSEIIRDCWENDPNLRPSFSQLISQLKGLQCLIVERSEA